MRTKKNRHQAQKCAHGRIYLIILATPPHHGYIEVELRETQPEYGGAQPQSQCSKKLNVSHKTREK